MKNLAQIREVSTLSFNERVLQEAEDERNPLMERLKFLGIFSSNMDEFYKVRVASIKRRIELGKRSMGEVLEAITAKSLELDERFRVAYDNITGALAREGVRLFTEEDIARNPDGLDVWLTEYFREEVLPSLVPIILQSGQPFPRLTDGAVYLGVKMWAEVPRYAILEIPPDLPRFIGLPGSGIMYIDDVIRHSLNDIFYIFPYDRIEAFQFKFSRDAQLDIDNDFTEGYTRKMERVLEQRKGGRPTRFVYDSEMPSGLLTLLLRKLKLTTDDALIAGGRYHNMKDLMGFPARRPDLGFAPMEPVPHPVLDAARRPMLDLIAEQDLLVTYPYQSFDHLIRLLREAAIDPAVAEIKMTLYRAAKRSQVVNALINAVRNGKRVFVSIELQARFDEKNNISIAEKLREEGAEVVFGIPPMKVHSKLLLIKKRNGKRLVALSTGNFSEKTGRLYVDSVLFTSEKQVVSEVDEVFTLLDEASRMRTLPSPKFKQLLVSPFNTRDKFLRLLKRERDKGADGYLFLKVNHLTDPKVIAKLREAADAGVKMDLVVRTTYAMMPHENIRAISILDRFLEHQRCCIFGKGDDMVVYMSSSDLMERNLDWRVEVAFPINDPALKRQVADMMRLQTEDTAKARVLDETQSNRYVEDGPGHRRAQNETHQYLQDLYDRSRA
jgi:polyphosphate kinase